MIDEPDFVVLDTPMNVKIVCCCVLFFLLVPTMLAHAQIVRDGSIGPPGGPLTGPNYKIDSTLGAINGSNLFHSFSQFNLNTTGSTIETATFTNSQPVALTNVISRVTGGQASSINGGIISQIPGASFYFVNPSGVMFGPNASLNISGSFYVSTANYLRFVDGAKFYASLSPASTLSSAPVVAFGFLGPTASPISVSQSQLSVPAGQTLSLIGGDLQITGSGGPARNGPPPNLKAPGGQINLVSVASAGEAVLESLHGRPVINVDSFTALGQINLVQGAGIDASGQTRATVLIRGGRVVLDDSYIFADHDGSVLTPGVGIDLLSTQELVLQHKSFLTADSLDNATGRGGDILIRTPVVKVLDGSILGARAFGQGDGGNIEIETNSIILTLDPVLGGAQIDSSTALAGQGGTTTIVSNGPLIITGNNGVAPSADIFSRISSVTRGSGNAGQVVIRAPSITLQDAVITTDTFSTGAGGSIGLTALSGGVSLINGAQVSSSTQGAGSGGNVTIQSPVSIAAQGKNAGGLPSALVSNARLGSSGRGGTILISAPTMSFQDMVMTVRTDGTGRAGDLTITGNQIMLGNGTAIQNNTFGSGQGGSVQVAATNSIEINGPNSVSEQTGIFSQTTGGDAGTVLLSAPSITLVGGAIKSDTLSNSSSGGRAGDITVQGGQFNVSNGAQVSSTSFGPNPGGAIKVQMQGVVSLMGQDSGLFTNARSSGKGGTIEVQGQQVNLGNGAIISASSTGSGDAGNIQITAVDSIALAGSSITTAANQAFGGNINLNAANLVSLQNSQITTSVQSGSGNGGNITIDPQFVVLNNSQIIAQAVGGNGGNITITAGVFLASPGSIVDASSQLGVNGTVSIQAPVQNLSGTLAPLQQAYLSAAGLLRQPCAARMQSGRASSFILKGRDGLPSAPGGLLPSPPRPLPRPAPGSSTAPAPMVVAAKSPEFSTCTP